MDLTSLSPPAATASRTSPTQTPEQYNADKMDTGCSKGRTQ